MSHFVLDASVVLAWCFPDENSSTALEIADRFKRGDTAIAPAFWPHEVLNALLAGEKRKRISRELTQRFLRDLTTLPVVLQRTPTRVVFDRIQLLSRAEGLTAYDAAYLDLALDTGSPLATLDDGLAKACNRAGVELMGG